MSADRTVSSHNLSSSLLGILRQFEPDQIRRLGNAALSFARVGLVDLVVSSGALQIGQVGFGDESRLMLAFADTLVGGLVESALFDEVAYRLVLTFDLDLREKLKD